MELRDAPWSGRLLWGRSTRTLHRRSIAQSKLASGSAAIADTVKKSSRDALSAFKTFARDPVGGLPVAYSALGEDKALRAGIAYGDVVGRLGDVYGPTVNIAARLTSVARPGTVLVDRGMHDVLSEGDTSAELRRVPRRSVKGYSRLEPFVLRRARDD